MTRYKLSIAAAVATLALSLGAMATPFNPKTIAASVFTVRSTLVNDGGTGFVIKLGNKQVLITNRHVCAMQTQGNLVRVTNATGKYVGAILSWSKESDLCLVSLPTNFDSEKHPALPLAKSRAAIGDVIHSFGYPRLRGPHMSSGVLVAIEPAYSQINGKWVETERVSFGGNPGQSGSPILNNRGEVIGVFTWILGNTYSCFVTLQDLKTFIKEVPGGRSE